MSIYYSTMVKTAVILDFYVNTLSKFNKVPRLMVIDGF